MAAAFVQEVVAAGTPSNSTTLVLTVSGVTTTVGNHLVIGIARRSSGGVSSVVDSKGNSWQIDKQSQASGASVAIASCKITTAIVSADTITVTVDSTDGFAASVAEYSGLDPTTWLDKTAGAAPGATGTASDSGATIATEAADELLVGVTSIGSSHSAFTPETVSPVWNQNTSASSASTVQTVRPMYRVVSATGTYSAKATWTTSRIWAAAIATYKAAGSAQPASVIFYVST